MKKFVFVMLLSGIFLISVPVSAQKSITPVASLDLQKYAGTWYEIGRYPNKLQRKCAGNVTVVYTRKPNGDLEIQIHCLGTKGIAEVYKTGAKIADSTANAKMKSGWGDHWVIDLDPNYQYAAVSDSKGENLWILGRAAKMSDAVYQRILRRVELMGFYPGKVAKTPQNVEVVKGAVIQKP
jgi:apolipoprotein D and lipocalin family protein